MNIVLFYNGQRGLSVLKKINKNHNVSLIILENKIFLKKTKKINKNVIISKRINSKKIIDILKKIKNSIFVVAGFSQIFKKSILKISKVILNLHAGKIPEYRGGSPLNWQIINNEKYFGLSILKMTKGIDNGPVYLQKKFKLKKQYTIVNLHKIANSEFPKMVNKVLNNIHNTTPKKQLKKKAKYWFQRRDIDGKIWFNEYSGNKIVRLTKALQKPYPYAWCLGKKNQKIRICEVIETNKKIKGPIGLVRIFNDIVYLKCISKNLIIRKYYYEKKRKKILDYEVLQ